MVPRFRPSLRAGDERGDPRTPQRLDVFVVLEQYAERVVHDLSRPAVLVERDQGGHPVERLGHPGQACTGRPPQLLDERGHLRGESTGAPGILAVTMRYSLSKSG